MMLLLVVLVVGAEVSAKTPKRPPPKCPFPTGPYVQPDCGPNEYFEICSYPHPPQNCSTLWTCYQPKETCCKPECRCKDGYLREDKSGRCIRRDECFNPCGPLEHFVRGSTECRKTCANYKVTGPQSMCKPFTGCVCNKGRVRLNDDATGVCILPKQCPARKCPRHEHWEDCPSVCKNETCISKSPDYKCLLPKIPLPCKPRCICDKGFLRNSFGHCIPEKHCPVKKCPINEVWRCASMCPRDSCAILEPGFKCPPGIVSVCIPACACKDGYLRNDKGHCIPKEFCPASLKCGINEVAVECATVYPPQTCESIYTLYERVDNIPCNPGCDCRSGYLRNKQNICVPSEFCPTVPPNQCGPNQEYKECGTACEPSCADLDNPNQICTDQCVAGCFCIEGYIKDDQGNCIPRDQCPLPVCNQPNEVAKECGSSCEIKTCEDYNRTDIVCPAVCIRGCFCIPGYVRNAYGVCVSPDQCPPEPVCLQANEEYQSCGSSCPDNCDNYLDINRICTMNCVPGCNCKKGYVRNLEDKTCVKPDQCPPKNCTGLNESLNYCASYCPITCANRFTNGDWACATVCRVGCDCIPGTLRNDSGVCVPVEQCTPPICRQNEKYLKCGTACPLTCENYKSPPQGCTRQCVEDCFCEDGYVRDRHLQCVKPENCEPICPAGEKFNECSAHCQDTCENYDKPNRVCTYQCQSGCVCEAGTVRRKDGKCVPPLECTPKPTCPNGTEVYSPCSAHCEPTCENSSPNQPCSRICKPGCKCIDGLVRRKDGQCVKVDDCFPQNQCGPNQEYNECGSACEPSCANIDNPNPILCTAQCVAGCFCIPGYVKDDKGNCIPRDQCPLPVCNKPNEVAKECGSGCEIKTCEDYKRTDIVCPSVCIRGCFCIPGYVRNADGVCISPDQCPPKPTCSNGTEVYSPCSAHCEPTCENSSPNQPCSRICKPGCKCIDGLVRRKDGQCVKVDECLPRNECGPNQVYKQCGTACETTCANLGNSNRICTQQCVAGCFCIKGYVKDYQGNCIPSNQCPSKPTCSNGTEVYSPCSAHCEPTCENSSPNQPCTRICKPGCKCIDGLVRRNKDGQCVKVDQCSQCPIDEVFDPCSAHCAPTCENHGPNRVCTAICKPGCKCRDGLVRRKDGKCVKLKDCSVEPICPAQEVYDPCSAHCEPTCDNNGPNRPCIDICTPGCKCQKGLVRRSDGKCVKLQDCQYKPQCPLNERWVDCVIGLCAPKSCDELGFPVACPGIVGPCRGGCVCAENYLRNKDGLCIPQKDCPSCGGDFNATSGCGNNCGNHCSDYDKPNNCSSLPLACQYNGCDCKDGFVFDDATGRCIAPTDCPSKNLPCSDPNAERVECASQCQSTCAQPVPGPCILSCKLNACVCKKGFILSEGGGKCIPVDQCPKDAPCNGDPNAVIKVNPLPCPSTCNAPNASPYCKKYAPPVGCECKPGYLKCNDDFDGKCIKPEECPGGNPCGVNGTFAWCNAGCPTNYCPVNDNRGIIACSPPYPCPSGCACKLNYRKKSYEDNRCILASDCPPVNCTRPNEIWSPCPSACLRENCADVNNQPTTCNTLVLNCQPQCICKKGHFRDDSGTCVPAKQCPNNKPCSDPNAERVECAPAPQCRSTCATPNPGPCILSCALNECVCKKGFVLSEKGGKCIPVDECPKDAPCNGDSNAVIKANPLPCPSTCKAPNASPFCKKYAPPVGCECKPGYLKSNDDFDGKCIKPEECPGGNPCGVNGTFVWCDLNCPTSYCPVNDKKPAFACDPISPCPSGCACKLNYKKKSYEDRTCILASECPPVNCTRPNEIWSPCPSECLREDCADINNQPTTCNTLVLNCQPRCICKKGHFRNKSGTCVPAKQCPNNKPCSDPNAERVECAPAPQCRSTCATPNPGPCILSCALNECVCKKGFVLSGKGGKCIPVDECPKDAPCNGDPNAVIKVNPLPCPSTCKVPNASPYCKKYAPPVGCECKPGYLKSNDDFNGKCIKPEECPGGNPCGVNQTFVWCNANCPYDYCPVTDEDILIGCDPPYPCPSGCACKPNYKKKSYEDNTCILASDCPKPIKCKENEVYNPCRIICPPQTCASPYTDYNCQNATACEPGCDCISGYLRNGTDKDLCIPSSQCPGPKPTCGLNEHYETNRCKCDLTCKNKDREAQIGPCPETSGCFCDDGFYRNSNGICVTKKQCPKPITCPANEVVSECYNTCHTTCKTRIRGDGRVCHLACIDTGCLCIPGYLRHDNGTCVPVNECSPPRCNENETYSACGTACPETCLNKGGNCTSCTEQCVEGCFCNKGFVRADDETCVKPKDCPAPVCSDPNEVFDKCPPYCPPGDDCSNIWSKFDCAKFENCCKPGCRCKSGYFRKKGICVPVAQCYRTQKCGPNEMLTNCYNDCQLTCKNRVKGYENYCTDECSQTGCICQPQYYRHDNGSCVLVEDCSPPHCNDDEEYNPCGTSCMDTCDERGNTCQDCSLQCVEGCFCPEGSYRALNGTCVKAADCPPRTCDGPNEYFDECPPLCLDALDDSCSVVWDGINCTLTLDCCEPQCRCLAGYYRNSEGLCIPADACRQDDVDIDSSWWQTITEKKAQLQQKNKNLIKSLLLNTTFDSASIFGSSAVK